MRRFWILASVGVLLVTGCGKFFPPLNPSGGGTTTTISMYVANGGVATIAGFGVANSTLTVLPNSPYTVGAIPTAIVVTPGNKYVYAGGSGAVYVYAVNTDGSLSIGNSKSPVISAVFPSALKTDSTGSWLLMADVNTNSLSAYSINASTGTLTIAATSPVVLDAGTVNHIALTPSNGFVYASLGTGGVDILSFNTSTGALAKVGLLKPINNLGADQGVAVDPTGTYVFVAETVNAGLRVLKIGANGALTETTGSPYSTGLGPYAVLVDLAGSYVYVTNRTDGTISGYSLNASGTLVALSGSPYTTGTNPVDLAEDSSKAYIGVVCSGGGPDMQLFKLDATTGGKLDPVATATTGTDPTVPAAIAATH